jgi:hypothetical protein
MILFDSQNEYSAMHYNSLCSCSHETKAADNFLPGSPPDSLPAALKE